MSFVLHCGYSDGILQSRNKTLMSCMVTTILTDCECYKTGAVIMMIMMMMMMMMMMVLMILMMPPPLLLLLTVAISVSPC